MIGRRILATLALSALLAGGASAKTLVYCSEGSPEGFDPGLFTAGTTFDATGRTIYERLVAFATESTAIEPKLAESWEVSKDGLEYTFRLRKGVSFHANAKFTPTREMNAEDVVFSFMRQLDKSNPYNGVSGGNWPYFKSMGLGDLIKSVQAVDPMTVKFTLNRPSAPFIADIAMDFASIVSKEYADAMLKAGTPEMMNQAPIGTGPFVLASYKKDAVIRYSANKKYWAAGLPKVDTLVFAITPDATVRYQKLLAGECHIMLFPNPADLTSMRQAPGVKLLEHPGLNIGYLAYNTTQKPFDNPNVRKALNMAIDKKGIVDVVFRGTGQVAKNPIPPQMWSYDDTIKDDPYDPEAAKALLQKEGISNLSMKVWAMPVQRPYNPNARRMAELIQADFAKVGVKAEIVSYEWGEYLKRAKAPDRDGAILLGWSGDNGDPDNFLSVLLGCHAVGNSNQAKWCYEPFETIVNKAKVLSGQAERAALYKQAQAIFKEQAPWATIAHSVVVYPYSSKVQGFKVNALDQRLFAEYDLAE